MKKLFLLSIIAVFSIGSMNAQGQLNGAISAGIPTGDASDFASFALALDLNYLLEISEDFSAGPSVGYNSLFLKSDYEGDNVSFLPIAAAGRLNVSEKLALGADVGYAVGLNEGNDGGFYYSPSILYTLTEIINIMLAYNAFNENGFTLGQITLGIVIALSSAHD